MHQLYGTFIGRWYMVIFGLAFAYSAVRHMGWRRTVIYALLAVAVGALFENASVHLGVPYTRYAFDPALRHKEIFLGDVPLMVPLSYTFLGYFAFASGRLLASGPFATRARHWWHEYALGVMLAVWALWILDPVSRLGQRWFLGRLFRYDGAGFWFGLPAGSQVGFALTAALLVGLLAWMTRSEPRRVLDRAWRHPHLGALLTYHGNIAMMMTVAFVLGADTLGGSVVLMWVPIAMMTVVYWSTLRPRPELVP